MSAGAVGVTAGVPGGELPPAPEATVASWRVVLLDGESGAELWSAPLRTGDIVVYLYTHSSAKTPVETWLRVENPEDGFVVERERHRWYGPGMEFHPERGVLWEDGWFIVPLERPVERLTLRVAGTVEQRLRAGSAEIVLGRLAPYGRRLVLEVRP